MRQRFALSCQKSFRSIGSQPDLRLLAQHDQAACALLPAGLVGSPRRVEVTHAHARQYLEQAAALAVEFLEAVSEIFSPMRYGASRVGSKRRQPSPRISS